MENLESKRKLLSPVRESIILEELGNEARTIAELSMKLGVSEATVRRDLESLENKGGIKRVHGGAVRLKFPDHEPVFEKKESLQTEEKQKIARIASELVREGDVIYLDGGSTVLLLAKILKDKPRLTVVTNSLMAAAELMESGHSLIIVGGEFRKLSRTMVGPLTSKIIGSLNISKAFLGTIGFSMEDGISTTDPDEAFTKEIVMQRAEKVIVLADSSKFGIKSLAVSGGLDDIDIVISDPSIPAKFAKDLKKRGIDLLT